jgi:hypothetical protein
MRQGYEGVGPYINDLQSKCIAVCNISLFFFGGLYSIYTLSIYLEYLALEIQNKLKIY